MRCPNESCAEVFPVREAPADQPPKGKSSPPGAGSVKSERGVVGETVPMVTAELVDDDAGAAEVAELAEPAELEEEILDVVEDEPPVKPAAPVKKAVKAPLTPPPVQRSPAAPSKVIQPPVREAAWDEAPPPVRQTTDGAPDDDAFNLSEPAPAAAAYADDYDDQPAKAPVYDYGDDFDRPHPRKRGRLILALLSIFLAAFIAGGVVMVVRANRGQEGKLAADADAKLNAGNYAEASKLYDELATKYPGSENTPKYRFLRDMAKVRGLVASPTEDRIKTTDELQKFVKAQETDNDGKKLLTEYRQPVWTDTKKLAEDMNGSAEKELAGKSDPMSPEEHQRADRFLKKSRELRAVLERYRDPAAPEPIPAELTQKQDNLAEQLDRERERAECYAKLKNLFENKPSDYRNTAAKVAAQYGMENDPQYIELLEKDVIDIGKHFAYVREQRPAVHQPDPPSVTVLVTPSLVPPPLGAPAREGIFFAVARGILYALNERDGSVRWFTRVGIDSTEIPVRVPPGAGLETETVLVVGTEPPSLTARDVGTGQPRWQQPLAAGPRGRPIVVERRVFQPLTDAKGTVQEFDLATGDLNGSWAVDEPYAAGGARVPGGSRLIYLPGNSGTLYVIDVGDGVREPTAKGILNAGHPPGSLRCAPILIGGEDDPKETQILVLCQADGVQAMKLRVFRQPSFEGGAPSLTMLAETRLPGWSWFLPHCDGDKFSLVTDAGQLGLFGVNQLGDNDPPLFPLMPEREGAAPSTGPVQRGQIVHQQEETFWAIVKGDLQTVRIGLDRRDGLKMAPIWDRPVHVGTPLHAGQVNAARDTLVMVTQTAGADCLATAVNAASGEIRWQRQLGLVSRGAPLALGGAAVLMDSRGGLYRLDPNRKPAPAAGNAQPAGSSDDRIVLADPLAGANGFAHLLHAADGQSAVAVVGLAGNKLVLRHLTADGKVTAVEAALAAAPVGTPALAGNFVVVPVADGHLYRIAVEKGAADPVRKGPTWRRPNAVAHAAHVTALSATDLLVSDGTRKLVRYGLSADGSFQDVPDAQQPVDLSARPVAPPVAVPTPDGTIQAVVADTSGRVSVLRGPSLVLARYWQLGGLNGKVPNGSIHAAPFVVRDAKGQARIGCLVDRVNLFWLDPMSEAPLWKFAVPGGGLVATPNLLDGDRLVLATLGGRLLALNAANGAPVGEGYELPAGAAPASTPLVFGAEQLFVPLADGSALLVKRSELLPAVAAAAPGPP
jgi:outer membrane protein assembly factor BamB